jgi:hypothetical protein
MPTFGAIESERVQFGPPIHWREARRGIAFGFRTIQGHKTVVNAFAPSGSILNRKIVVTETPGPRLPALSSTVSFASLTKTPSSIALASTAKVNAGAALLNQNLGQLTLYSTAAVQAMALLEETGIIVKQGKTSARNLGTICWISTETITFAAEQFAKSHRVYGALILAKDIVRKTMGSSMAALHIDRMDDPDEVDLATICFAITSRASVDATLERDNRLRETLTSKIPADSLLHFSFAYDFE